MVAWPKKWPDFEVLTLAVKRIGYSGAGCSRQNKSVQDRCNTRTQSRPLFLFLGFRFPYKGLYTKKSTLFIPRFLLDLEYKFGSHILVLLTQDPLFGFLRWPELSFVLVFEFTYKFPL